MKEQIKAVVAEYKKTQSLRRTAENMDLSTGKVRKMLLTAGEWSNDLSEEIRLTRENHADWSNQQIAEHLHISLKAVELYTPYKIGPYGEEKGESARRTADYRARNKSSADTPDQNRKEITNLMESAKEDTHENRPIIDDEWYEEQNAKDKAAGLPFPRFRQNPDVNAKPVVDDQFFLDYREVYPAHDLDRRNYLSALHLRLEVDLSEVSVKELKKLEDEYGVKSGWSRDIIVPQDIPLHHLHYVIQRAFGFENTADHLYQLPKELFASLVEEGSLRNYARLCGVLFRFPFGNDEELYWDDDYDGKKSVRSWLKEKYLGSWLTSGGTGYGYVDNQYRIWQWLGDRVLDFHKLLPAFEAESDEDYYEWLEKLGAPETYSIGEMDNAGIDEVHDEQFPLNNILENLTLEELMCPNPDSITAWDFEDGFDMAEPELLDGLMTLEKARKSMEETDKIYQSLQTRAKAGLWDEDTLLVKRWREAARRTATLYLHTGVHVSIPFPFTETITYLYDFGGRKGSSMTGEPKWKINIKVLEEYYDNSIYYSRNYTAIDAAGTPFQNDPEHLAEWADRLQAMCHWIEKLEITDSQKRWIRPTDESDMMVELRPEQQLLPEERERIEKNRARLEENRRDLAELHGKVIQEPVTIVDDDLYKALKIVMLESRPVCIAKEGSEPGEGYPDKKIRNSSIENLV